MKKFSSIFVCFIIIMILFGHQVQATSISNTCQRTILTLLAPRIEDEINKYYKTKLTESPTFAPFISINRVDISTFPTKIDVKVTVIPYVGPHIDVGKDIINFRINNSGKVTVLKYRHIKDYSLPPNWQHIIKR